MEVVKLFRLFSGYVRFRARGGFPERFINLCSNEGIPLWDISGGKRELYASTTLRGYRNIRKCAKKSGMLPRIIKRAGLPFWLRSHKSREGVLVGAVLSVSLIAVLSMFVWTVQVQGNEEVSTQEILAVFDEMGMHVGAQKRKIDVEKLKSDGLQKLPELSWLAVNIKGSAAVIEVRERVKAPQMAESGEPQNLVAACDGEIASVEVYEGKAAVKRGDAVLKGELLVNGIVTNYDSSVSLHHARGTVTAYTTRKIEHSVPYNQDFLLKNGNESSGISLSVFGLKIPIFPAHLNDETVFTHICDSFVETKKTKLPLGVIKTKIYGCDRKKLSLDEQRALSLASLEYMKKEQSELMGTAVLERNINVEFTEKACKIYGEYRCEEIISVPKKMNIEETG